MASKNRMVVIDDLEPIEAEMVVQFLQDAITNGDLELAVQDCMTIRDEVKFHQYDPKMLTGKIASTGRCFVKVDGVPCLKKEHDIIHTKAYEVEGQ